MVDRVMSPNSPRTKRFFPTSTAAAAHLPAFSIPETSVYIVLTTDRAGLILIYDYYFPLLFPIGKFPSHDHHHGPLHTQIQILV